MILFYLKKKKKKRAGQNLHPIMSPNICHRNISCDILLNTQQLQESSELESKTTREVEIINFTQPQ